MINQDNLNLFQSLHLSRWRVTKTKESIFFTFFAFGYGVSSNKHLRIRTLAYKSYTVLFCKMIILYVFLFLYFQYTCKICKQLKSHENSTHTVAYSILCRPEVPRALWGMHVDAPLKHVFSACFKGIRTLFRLFRFTMFTATLY